MCTDFWISLFDRTGLLAVAVIFFGPSTKLTELGILVGGCPGVGFGEGPMPFDEPGTGGFGSAPVTEVGSAGGGGKKFNGLGGTAFAWAQTPFVAEGAWGAFP